MRLFIAINFNEEIKDRLQAIMDKLKAQGFLGNFTKRENLHLTIAFLGEVENNRIGDIKEILNLINLKQFNLNFSGLGFFNKRSNTVFLKTETNEYLNILNKFITYDLSQKGFIIEEREYKPHLTLIREANLIEKGAEIQNKISEFNNLILENGKITSKVLKISLIKSERVNNKLYYSELYAKNLKE